MTFQSDKGIEEINKARQGHGAPPLKCDWILEDNAQVWADFLAQNAVQPECKTKIVVVLIDDYFLLKLYYSVNINNVI